MSHIHYSQILPILYVNDNFARLENDTDRLYKIRLMITQLKKQFQHLYQPSQNQTVNEAIILFNGRSSIKPYYPMKPIKRGFKMWCRAEGNASSMYTRVRLVISSNVPYDIGLHMNENPVGKGHVLYFDNYFSFSVLTVLLDAARNLCVLHYSKGQEA